MAVKTVDRTFLRGQSVELFRAAIKSQATRDPYERRLTGFLKKMNTASPDSFVEFAKNNPVLVENKNNRVSIYRTYKSRPWRNLCRYYKQLGQSSKAFP